MANDSSIVYTKFLPFGSATPPAAGGAAEVYDVVSVDGSQYWACVGGADAAGYVLGWLFGPISHGVLNPTPGNMNTAGRSGG